MDFDDQLPCGGYVDEDQHIKQSIKQLSIGSDSNHKACCSQQKDQQCCQQPLKEEHQCSETKQELVTKNECKEPMVKKQIKNPCKKCKTNEAVLVQKNEQVCRQCLLKNIEYKCRLALENQIQVKCQEPILVCFSGGLNSICLAHIMVTLKRKYKKHNLFGKLYFVHIQQQKQIPEGYANTFQQIFGEKLHVIDIAQVMESEKHTLQDIIDIFQMFGPSANTLDLLEIFRDRLLLQFARQNQINMMLKASNGEKLAIDIFRLFTKGVGGNINEISGTQKEEHQFSYPFRQHLLKELQYYFYAHELGRAALKAEEDDLMYVCTSQIDHYLNKFINNLQNIYSHTASAIVRISEKIESNLKQKQKCKWCGLKTANEVVPLCQRCVRLFEGKNEQYAMEKIPSWMQI